MGNIGKGKGEVKTIGIDFLRGQIIWEWVHGDGWERGERKKKRNGRGKKEEMGRKRGDR